MHLKPGKATYRLLGVGILQGATYKRAKGDTTHMLTMIELPRLLEMRHEATKRRDVAQVLRPLYFAYCFERSTIELHPAPQSFGELWVRYYPMMKVA